MAGEFEILNAKVNIDVNSGNVDKELAKVQKTLNELKKSKNLGDFSAVSTGLASTTANFNSLNAVVKQNGQLMRVTKDNVAGFTVEVQQTGNTLNEAAQTMSTLGNRFRSVQETALNTNRTFGTVFRDFASGVALMRDGGSKLVAIRQTFFGLGTSTNFVAKTLDSLTRNANNLTFSYTRLQKASLETAQKLADVGTAGQSALRIIKDIAKAEGFADKNTFQGLVTQVQNVTNEYQRLERTIQSGGKPTKETLARIAVEARALEKEFELLSNQGIIGGETRERLKILINEMRAGTQGTKLLQEQMEALEKQEQRLAAQGTKTGNSIFQMVRNMFAFGGRTKESSQAVEKFATSTKNAAGQVVGLGKSLKQAETNAVSLSESFKVSFAGNFLANIATDLTNKLAQIPGALIAAASNAEETQNRFQAVFKTSVEEAEKFVEVLANEVGRDPFKIKDSISSLQAFNVGLGFSEDQSLEMSETIQSLIFDFASFNNITDEDATARFLAALSGSSEVMDKFGVNIKEAALEQESFRIGINKASADLTEQEKVILRLSIIQNSLTEQGALGDAVTTAGSFANQTKRLNANLSQLATTIGVSLLPTIAPFLQIINRLLESILPKVTTTFQAIFGVVQAQIEPIALAISSVFDAENTDVALNNLYTLIIDTLSNILDSVTSFAADAFDWGVAFIENIADGIFSSADSVLASAVDYATGIISDFLMPGSPPERGPLSNIDTWGKELLDTFGSSFKDSDFGRTLEQELSDANRSVLSIRQQVIDAEKDGYVPPELLERLRLAEEEKKQIQQRIKDTEKLGKAEKASSKEAKSESGGRESPERAGREREQTEKKTAQQIREDALKILDQQLKDGIIKHEDYVKEKLKIETKFYEDTLEAGEVVDRRTVDNIRSLQEEADAIAEDRKKKKKGGLDSALDFDTSQITGPVLERIGKAGEDAGKKFVEGTGKSIKDSLSTLSDIMVDSYKKIAERVGKEFIFALTIALDFEKLIKLREGKGILSLILGKAGLLAPVQKAIEPIFKLLAKLSKSPFVRFIDDIITRMGIFGVIFRKIIGLLGSFAGPLALIVNIWAHWEEIVFVFNTIINTTREFIDRFVQRLGGVQQAQAIFDSLIKSANGFFIRLKGIFTNLLRDLGEIDFGLILKSLLEGDFSTAFTTLSTGLQNAFGTTITKLRELLANSRFDDIVRLLADKALTALISLISAKAAALRTAFLGMLPPGILSLVDEIRIRFNSVSAVVTETIIPAFVRLADFFTRNLAPSFANIRESFNAFLAQNAPQLVVIVEKLSSIWDSLSQQFGKAAEVVNVKLGPPFGALAKTLGLVGDEAGDQGAGGILLRLFGRLLEFGVDTLLNNITNAINLVVIALTAFDEALQAGQPLLNFFADVSGVVFTNLLKAVDNIATFANKVIEIFTNLYNTLIGNSIIPDIITGITNAFGGAFLTDIPALLTTFAVTAASKFLEFGATIVTNIVNGIKNNTGFIAEALGSLFSGGGGDAVEPTQPSTLSTEQLTQAQGLISQLGPMLAANSVLIQNSITTFSNLVNAAILALNTGIETSFIALQTALLGEDSILISISEGTVAVLNSMVFQVETIFDTMVTETTNIIQSADWKEIGAFIIEGLQEGLLENKEKFLDTVRTIAEEAIGVARDILGIASPSTVFLEIGASVAEGFNEGLALVPPTIGGFIGAARDEAEDFLEQFLDSDVASNVLSQLTRAFRENSDVILNATDRVQAFRDVVSGLNLRPEDFGGAAGLKRLFEGKGQGVLGFLLNEFDKQREEQVGQFTEGAADFIRTINTQAEEVVSQFTITLENVRFQTNSTRNTLEDFFKEPITDDKLSTLFKQVTEQGADFGKEINDSIKIAFLSQQKLNASLEDQMLIEEQIRQIQQAQLDINEAFPPPPPPPDTSALDAGLALLDGLQLGIDATVPEVLDSLTQLTNQMIQQIQDALEIASPSGVFMQIGNQIGQGLFDGIVETLDQIPSVNQALSSALTNGLVPTVNPNVNGTDLALAPAVATGTAPVIQVNNNISNNMDLALVERRIINTIKRSIQ